MVFFCLMLGCSKKEQFDEVVPPPRRQAFATKSPIHSVQDEDDNMAPTGSSASAMGLQRSHMLKKGKRSFLGRMRNAMCHKSYSSPSRQLERMVNERIDQELSPYMVQVPTPRNEIERASFQQIVEQQQALQQQKQQLHFMQLRAKQQQKQLAADFDLVSPTQSTTSFNRRAMEAMSPGTAPSTADTLGSAVESTLDSLPSMMDTPSDASFIPPSHLLLQARQQRQQDHIREMMEQLRQQHQDIQGRMQRSLAPSSAPSLQDIPGSLVAAPAEDDLPSM